jgi:surfactin synthase thioesterase subunit
MMPVLDRPFVFVGHSLGAWIAFELTRELRRRNSRLPDLLVVAAARAPDTELPDSPLHLLPDREFVTAMQQRYGGIPQTILDNAEALRLLLPVVRADIEMVERYRYEHEPSLDADFLVLGGTDDPVVSPAQLADWRRHTSKRCSVCQFPGGHFFLFRGGNQDPPTSAPQPPSPALRTIMVALERLMQEKRTLHDFSPPSL